MTGVRTAAHVRVRDEIRTAFVASIGAFYRAHPERLVDEAMAQYTTATSLRLMDEILDLLDTVAIEERT